MIQIIQIKVSFWWLWRKHFRWCQRHTWGSLQWHRHRHNWKGHTWKVLDDCDDIFEKVSDDVEDILDKVSDDSEDTF